MQKLNENIIYTQYPDAEVVLIAFTGGYEKDVSASAFEWLQATESYPYSRIFVRDTTGRMCIDGIDKEFDTFDKLMSALREILQSLKATRIITIGASAAAFPAVVTAHMLKADYCHAFAPLPYTNPLRAVLRRDGRVAKLWWQQGMLYHLTQIHKSKYNDLRKVLSNTNGHTQYFIHLCRYRLMDMKRAQYIADLPNVNLIDYPCDQHNVARYMAKHKCLRDLFDIDKQGQLLKLDCMQNALSN